MKHILLIANVNGHDTKLLRYAARFCNDNDLRLHLLQIEENSAPTLISSPSYFNKMGYSPGNSILEKKKELANFVIDATKNLISSDWVSSKIMSGNVEHCLNTFVNQEQIDLILVGQSVFTKEHIADNHIFKQLLLNVSELPTLIIPDDCSYQLFKKTAYLTTLKGDDYNNLKDLRTLFPDTSISVLHFSQTSPSIDQKKKIQYLQSEFKKTALHYEIKQEDIEDFVRRESQTLTPEFDLITLRTRKRNFWQRLLDPSTALYLILQLGTPTLLFKYRIDDE
mgnify:CR=1 FL=1|tara:strand:+ start:817 stop:1659 length:843 start_codon:yes stop_codon:yes gene_type:complete